MHATEEQKKKFLGPWEDAATAAEGVPFGPLQKFRNATFGAIRLDQKITSIVCHGGTW